MKDYYAVLQVAADAEVEVIDAAFKKLTLKYHPDASSEPCSEQRMKDLNDAAAVLRDPDQRKEYDARLREWTDILRGEEERARIEAVRARETAERRAATAEERAVAAEERAAKAEASARQSDESRRRAEEVAPANRFPKFDVLLNGEEAPAKRFPEPGGLLNGMDPHRLIVHSRDKERFRARGDEKDKA